MSELWGPIAPGEWRSVPCTTGRVATDADMKAGRAVFHIRGESAPVPMEIPCCAVQVLEGGAEQPVVVVQAEKCAPGIVFGVRPLSGGNGVCMEGEVRLLQSGFGPVRI
jgi:hypothetical protein